MRRVALTVALTAFAVSGCVPLLGGGAARGGQEQEQEQADGVFDALEQTLRDGQIGHFMGYADRSSTLTLQWYGESGASVSAKRKARLAALDVRAAAVVGSPLADHFGDGTRVTTSPAPAALAGIQRAIELCNVASQREDDLEALRQRYDAYREAFEYAVKADPAVVRYVGPIGDGAAEDVATRLMRCQAEHQDAVFDIEDQYDPDTAHSVPVTKRPGCGVMAILLDGVQVGPNRFSEYRYTPDSATAVRSVPCGKIPAKSKVGRPFSRATRDVARRFDIPLIFAVDGRPEIRESDLDGRLHRYQKVLVYSRRFGFSSHFCGDPKLMCEGFPDPQLRGTGLRDPYSARRAIYTFNRLEYGVERADVHAGLRPARCRALLEQAGKDARQIQATEGTFLTGRGERLPAAELMARVETMMRQADERLLTEYCYTRPKQ